MGAIIPALAQAFFPSLNEAQLETDPEKKKKGIYRPTTAQRFLNPELVEAERGINLKYGASDPIAAQQLAQDVTRQGTLRGEAEAGARGRAAAAFPFVSDEVREGMKQGMPMMLNEGGQADWLKNKYIQQRIGELDIPMVERQVQSESNLKEGIPQSNSVGGRIANALGIARGNFSTQNLGQEFRTKLNDMLTAENKSQVGVGTSGKELADLQKTLRTQGFNTNAALSAADLASQQAEQRQRMAPTILNTDLYNMGAAEDIARRGLTLAAKGAQTAPTDAETMGVQSETGLTTANVGREAANTAWKNRALTEAATTGEAEKAVMKAQTEEQSKDKYTWQRDAEGIFKRTLNPRWVDPMEGLTPGAAASPVMGQRVNPVTGQMESGVVSGPATSGGKGIVIEGQARPQRPLVASRSAATFGAPGNGAPVPSPFVDSNAAAPAPSPAPSPAPAVIPATRPPVATPDIQPPPITGIPSIDIPAAKAHELDKAGRAQQAAKKQQKAQDKAEKEVKALRNVRKEQKADTDNRIRIVMKKLKDLEEIASDPRVAARYEPKSLAVAHAKLTADLKYLKSKLGETYE